MPVGDKLSAVRYNDIRNRINNIFGPGSGQSGYGQTLSSNAVSLGSNVTITDFLNLRSDLIRARQHQTGVNELGGDYSIPSTSVDAAANLITVPNHGFANNTKVLFAYVPYAGPSSIDPVAPGNLTYNTFYYIVNATTNTFQLSSIPSGPAIDITSQGAGTHSIFSGFPVRTSSSKITEADALNLEDKMTPIENEKFLLGAGQSTPGSGDQSTRTNPWNTSLTHAVTIDFSTPENARYFFNAGGEIRTRATLTGATGSIGTDWSTMLTNMGTIQMNHTLTTATGTGTGSNIGFYDLTTVNQQIFTRTGSGAYAANDYTVFARCDVANNTNGGARYIYLTIQFNDDKAGNPNFDENVTGTLDSFVEFLRPSGSNVSVTGPVTPFTRTTALQ